MEIIGRRAITAAFSFFVLSLFFVPALEETAYGYGTPAIIYNQHLQHEATVRAVNKAYEVETTIIGDGDVMLAGTFAYAAIGRIKIARNLPAISLRANPAIRQDPDYQRVLRFPAEQTQE